MANKNLNFKVSAGLKNIIGNDLISDDFIAVFEVVKNSFDAYAKDVRIIFEKDKIIIWDDGKGMNYDDIDNKWLFVAYSAKKQGLEDEELKGKQYSDYRNKISPAQYYAGAKGIGRFSCDRLGEKLLLTSRKAGQNSKLEQLKIDWGKFEVNPQEKFEKIKVIYIDPPDNSKYRNLKNGTIIEITSLRSSWNRKKILDLKHSLEKLINPFDIIDENRKTNSRIPKRKFNIIIEAEAEINRDEKEGFERNKVNGKVQNFIFETLRLKTTQIFCEISEDGKSITTELIDRGKTIYKIVEPNSNYKLLSNIRFHLFYLNQAAKYNFKILMGISSVEFGSVFLYKNGFRVYPFGEEGEDSFGLDRRKQQGHSRYLGTREIIGRIEIHGSDDEFTETSSRDGGLKITPSYVELEECFIQKCLRRLERYVVDIQWELKDKSQDLSSLKDSVKASARIASIISKLVDSKDVVLEEYPKDFLQIINDKLTIEDASDETFQSLEKIAQITNDRAFYTEIRNAKKRYDKLLKEKEEAEDKARKEQEARVKAEERAKKIEEERRKTEEAYERERKKNLFFNAIGKDNNKATLGLIHHIKLTSKALNSRVKILTKDIVNEKFDPVKTLEILSEIKVHSEKILKLSEIVSYSDLNFKYAKHSGDLIRFIEEYIAEVKNSLPDIDFSINSNKISYITDFSILEFSIILDNLISNSEKLSDKNKKIQIDIHKKGKGIKIVFSDSGIGVSEQIKDHIFDLGFTTTRGSGIGLYTTKDLIQQMGGELKFIGNKKILKGASFEITF